MNQLTSRTVAMLTGDLLFASKVKSAAQAAGWTFYMGGNLPAENADDIKIVILDLSTRSGLTEKIISQSQAACPDARVIAYGPHVQVDKLKAAREAGIQTVLTNGQLDASVAELFS
ncbi:hypothetical protein LF1_20200 [Rubripirellula obstinata]|uniref:Response regulatory domain-containing protein n=1 Tax=Rubripirellula obstinata TaxID=406547 RepID=A0A5B1CG17_9BACT|nr:histidine kinase [Rubripirellula obstinata]KAA1259486.1 hypothetical protein LF1_20200 [Rubripirellula obstinata]